MTRTDTLLAAALPDIIQRLLALDAELFGRYARRTPAMAAMGFPERVPPPGFSLTDLADASSLGDIEVLSKFQDLPLMGLKFTGKPVVCAGVAVRNVYYFWTSPMSALVGHLRHALSLPDAEIVFRLTLSALLHLRRRAVRHGAYFPGLRLYEAKGRRDAQSLSCPDDPVVEDSLVFCRILLEHLERKSGYADYLSVLPLFINERVA